ncbi:MAG TPA: sensor histidine kinase [Bacteroidales bacterium]
MEKNNSKKRTGYFVTILWILFLIVIPPVVGYLFKGPKIFSSISYYFTYTSIGYAYGIAFGVGNPLIGKYTATLDWAKNPKRTNLISFLLFIGYGIIVSVTIPYIVDVYLWDMTGSVVFYDVMAKAFMTVVADLIVLYFYSSVFITNNWIKSIEKNEELKRENLLAKYEALKNQVNPHFLFNNLNTLSGIVEQKPELATDFIKKLSDIYRYVLEQNDKELVSIKDEIKFVDDYVFLTKMRFGKGLIFNSHITDAQSLQVVPLGIQMLVENAIKHNIISDDMPLRIEMELEDGFVVVRNNLQKKKTINHGKEPLGLENIKKRYAYLSDTPVEVTESDRKFIVKLPVIKP